jgi:NAD+ diphosphatase
MKDIFFGCSKQIARYAYLRRDIQHMKKLQSKLNKSKLIIFNNRNNSSNRLEVLIKSGPKLATINLKDYEIFNNLLLKWLLFNIKIQDNVNSESVIPFDEIDNDLKNVSIFWLGIDDLKIFNDENLENSDDIDFTPIYSIDISKSDELCDYVEKNLKHYEFSSKMGNILGLSNEESTVYAYAKMYIDFTSKNNYCPSCAGHVIPVNLGSRLYCLNDSPFGNKCKINLSSNNFQYPRTDPVVIISLYDERGRILLGNNNKRHPPSIEKIIDEKSGKEIELKKTFYSCFAGFMEPGETIEHACIREVYEETGLKIDEHDIQIIESQPWPFPANLMVGCIGILRNEQTNDSNINIHLDEELDNVQWFDSSIVGKVLQREEQGIISKTSDLIEEWYGPPPESVAGRLIEKSVKNCLDKIAVKL